MVFLLTHHLIFFLKDDVGIDRKTLRTDGRCGVYCDRMKINQNVQIRTWNGFVSYVAPEITSYDRDIGRGSLFPIYKYVQILLYEKFINAFIAYLPWIITMSLCKGNSSAAGPGTLTVIRPRTPPSINTVWYHSSLDAASLVTPLEA